MVIKDIVLIFLSALSVGLMGGLFFSWSVAVMPGLKTLGNTEFVLAMQAMNKSIQNPLFFAGFFGAAVLLPVSYATQYDALSNVGRYLLLASAALYVGGVFFLTIGGNIPLNNMLERFNVSDASAQTTADIRLAFERRWSFLNNIRTCCCCLSFACLLLMLLLR